MNSSNRNGSQNISYVWSVGVIALIVLFFNMLPRPELDLNATEVMIADYMKQTPFGGKLLKSQATKKVVLPSEERWSTYPLTGATIAVTGATSGIGKSIARTAHGLGATVIAIGRSPSKLNNLQVELEGTEAKNSRLISVLMDLTDLESVSQAAKEILTKVKRLDILVNNAGIHYSMDVSNPFLDPMATKQGYDLVFGVNYLSHFLLTSKLLPLLEKSKLQPRVVQISSSFHYMTDGSELQVIPNDTSPIASQSHRQTYTHKNRSYANSKLAQIYHMRSLSRRLQKYHSSVKVISVCPGWVSTNIGGFMTRVVLPKLGAFPVDGIGISSSLNAMFAIDVGDETTDFVPQTGLVLPTPWIPTFLETALHWLQIRDILISSLGVLVMLLGQNMMFQEKISVPSSTESYDVDKQESLYEWSEQAVSAFL